jgi:glycosyl hydrolase family 131
VTPQFDVATNTKAFAINLDDKSIFIPQGGEAQANIRRADLLPSIRSQLNDVAVSGIRTMHFSVQRDPAKPLNATHDYQIMNLESKDFSFRTIDVRTGAENGNEIAVFGNSNTTPAPQKVFSVPFGEGAFENFAIKMDFTAKYVSPLPKWNRC